MRRVLSLAGSRNGFVLAFLIFFCFPLFSQDYVVEESWESLRNRPYPQWFKDAKLGVFIHWGVYSVPSYGGPESYAEWYLRGLQAGAQNRIDFMKEYWGEDFEYEDFAPLLKAELFDADEWAEIFERAGAKYIILVSKHHDGYCLWPSEYAPGWNSVDVGPMRDVVGEVADAVRKREIKFGLYYSLPEWNHPLHRWYIDPHEDIHPYIQQHMIPQFKEVVSTYKPHVLFTDGEWFHSAEDWNARQLIAWYYNLVGPDAIVNDRWGHGADIGFKTPEYSSGRIQTDRPWAEVRGLGRSFGLNRNEKLEAYMSPEELIHFFARAVANGGGITINVGPGADGKIPLLQQERLEQLGAWIRVNEEAIYASTQWSKNGEEKEVTLERIDPQVHFNWVRNSPGQPISEDNFTATWTGYIMPDFSEEYLFSAVADDGMRLYIDGQLVLDMWNQTKEGTQSEAMREGIGQALEGKVRLRRGQKYPIRVEYREDYQNANISLFWESRSLPREVVPQKNLFSRKENQTGDGLSAVYRSMYQYLAYTHNHGNLYAIAFEWPDEVLTLPIAEPDAGTSITLLGREGDLPWKYENGKLKIDVSQVRYNEIPGHYAWTFKIENYE
ncbi:MAG: alpha-L-fucosidase [Bacteroidales bacterium]|nr:alpha-L-fucosidase [Bacteroidales bacterium]